MSVEGTRRRRRGPWWVLGAVLVLAVGALAGADSAPRPPGDSLIAIGLIAGGDFGLDAPRAGSVYDFAFSPLHNVSSHRVTVLGFRVVRTSSHLRVLGYRLYSAEQLGGVYTGYEEGQRDSGVDLDHAPRAHFPYTVAPHADSDRYAVARVEVTAFPPPGYVKGCEVIYRVGSEPRAYVQRFGCTYYFGEHAQDYFDGRATLRVANHDTHDVTFVRCPGCKPRPIMIGGGGVGIGWDLERGESRGVTAVVDGRRVECRPPTGPAGAAYAAMHGPDLYYEITRKGQCVLQK